MVGRRVPDLDIETTDGPTRIYRLLEHADPLFIDFGLNSEAGADALPTTVRRIAASYSGAWHLPVIGEVQAPTAVLVRPDGYVAWAGTAPDGQRQEALTTWFGP